MSLILDEHRIYLSDAARVDAFRRAIRETVRPGDVVIDLGCGTGILGLLACEAGAARVYAVDSGSIIGLAREVARANGFGDRILHLKGSSTRIDLPAKADVLVADQIGRFGFEAGVLGAFEDARHRLLKPNARTVPIRIEQWIAPVELPEARDDAEFWMRRPQGFDFTPAVRIGLNTGYPVTYKPEHLLAEPVRLSSYAPDNADPFSHEAASVITRAGELHGIGGWFLAHLSDRVTMTNSPLAKDRIVRQNVFFPIEKRVAVQKGDRVKAYFHVIPRDVMVTWRVEILPVNGAPQKFAHSTLKGMLLDAESLRRERPDFVPILNRWGEARRTLVNLCDGRRKLAEIEQEVFQRHRELFPSFGQAQAFVAEVVVGYASN